MKNGRTKRLKTPDAQKRRDASKVQQFPDNEALYSDETELGNATFNQNAVRVPSFQRISRLQANTMMNNAFNKAIELMEGNEKCREAVSSNQMDALTQARRLSAEGQFHPRQNEVKGNAIADAFPATVQYVYPAGLISVPTPIGASGGKVNLYNIFFGGFDIDVGNVLASQLGLNEDDRRVLSLLHELAHITRRNYHASEGGTTADAMDTLETPELNALIWDACFGKKK